MKLKKLMYSLSVPVLMLLVAPSFVIAQTKPLIDLQQPDVYTNATAKKLSTVPSAIAYGFTVVVTIAGVVFVVLFLIGGIMYMTSFGNDEQSKKAKQLLLDAIIGLVLVVTAWAVGTYVLELLGLKELVGINNGIK